MKINERTIKFLVLYVSVCLQIISFDVRASDVQIKFSTDTTYNGIAIDSSQSALFYDFGLLRSAMLKSDSVIDGIVYKSGTSILLHPNGRVDQGTLQEKRKIEEFPLKENTLVTLYPDGKVRQGVVSEAISPGGKNLVVPASSLIQVSSNGTVSYVIPQQSEMILGLSIKSCSLVFDRILDAYKLRGGTLAASRVIAMIPTGFDSNGGASSFFPVVAPTDSLFGFPVDDYGQETAQVEVWTIKGNFSLNGQNLGYDPILHIKNLNVLKVVPTQNIMIGNTQVKAGTTLIVDRGGVILSPK